MPDTTTMVVFATGALALLLVPGPAVMFIAARSLERGRAAGIVSALGLSVGSTIHVLAAAGGLSALIARSALWFGVVRYVGAAYLIYLGVRTLAGRASREPATQESASSGLSRLFVEGLTVNVLNPKLALFFLAFLPQFVDVTRAPAPPQILALGATFVTLGTVTDTAYALAVGSARGLLMRDDRTDRRWARLSGATYIGLGLYAGLAGGRARR